MSASSDNIDDWEKDFEKDLINKKCSFLKLMYDKNNIEQREILRKIASGNRLDVKLWLQYIECTVNCKTNKEKQLQLLRMVNTCLSLLSPVEGQLSEDSSFLAIHLHVIALKRSDDQAIQYFATVMSRNDKNKKLHDIIIGRTHATLYLRWCETILRLTEAKMATKDSQDEKNRERYSGVCSAIKVLQTAIENKVTPNGQIKVQLRDLVKEGHSLKDSFAGDGVVSFHKSKTIPSAATAAAAMSSSSSKSPETVAESDESTDEVTQTEVIEHAAPIAAEESTKRSTRSAAATAAALEDVKTLRVSRTGLSGKCVRLSKTGSDENCAPAATSAAAPSPSTAAAAKPPVNLSLYVDDKLKNFNPVWKPKDSPLPQQSVKPDTPIVPLTGTASASRSKIPFSIADTNIEVSTPSAAVAKKTAGIRRIATPAVEVDEEPHNPLNDSVVEFKQTKRPRVAAAAAIGKSVKSPKKDTSVVFKGLATDKASTTVASPASDSDEEGDGNTQTATLSLGEMNETVKIPQGSASSRGSVLHAPAVGDVSVFYDGETVKIEDPFRDTTMEVDVEEKEPTVTAEEADTQPVQPPVTIAAESAASSIAASTPSVAGAAAGKLTRSHTEPAPVISRIPVVVAAAAASPMPASALATPISGKQKKRSRVSFAGNEDLPPVMMPAATEDPATASKLHNGKHIDATASAHQKSVSSLASGKNMLDDPTNRVVMNGREYIQLGALGKGGSGVVTRVIAKDSGVMYAYKRISIPDNLEPEVIEKQIDDHMKEISLLKQLNGSPLIVELIDSEINREEGTVCMVLEMGETDLAKVLIGYQKQGQEKSKAAATGSTIARSLDPFYARMIWKEMLECVQCIHMKNIIHGDLKPANFVFVKGHLKLIDFGIANSITNDTTNVYLQSQVGTLNYMSPEALTPTEVKSKSSDPDSENQNERTRTMRLGRSSDVWSLGCILYQMMYGRPPFAAHSMFQKIGVITDPNHVIEYPAVNGCGSLVDPAAIESMKACLIHDRTQRRTIGGPAGLLNMNYLTMTSGGGGVSVSSSSASVSSLSSSSLDEREPVIQSANQVKGVVDAVLSALCAELSFSRGSSTPSKRAKVDSLLALINAVDGTALQRAVASQLKLGVSSSSFSNNTSLELSMDSDLPQKIQRTSSHGGHTGDVSKYPSTPSGKIPSSSSGAGLSSTAKVKRLFASSLASTLAGGAVGPSATSMTTAAVSTVPFADASRSSGSSSAGGAAVSAGSQQLSAVKKARTPLKALPLNIQNQITAMSAKSKLNSVSSSVGAKWMKPVTAAPVNDMRSAMEERLGNMRKFMNPDQDDITVTETIDNTGFNFDQF